MLLVTYYRPPNCSLEMSRHQVFATCQCLSIHLLTILNGSPPCAPQPRRAPQRRVVRVRWRRRGEAVPRAPSREELNGTPVRQQAGEKVSATTSTMPSVRSLVRWRARERRDEHHTRATLLTTHYSLLTTYYLILTTHYLLLTTYYTAYYSLLTTYYLLLTILLTTHYSLLTTYYLLYCLLLTTHYSLLTT